MNTQQPTFELEREAVLIQCIDMMQDIDDMRYAYWFHREEERKAAIAAKTADLMAFRDAHDITPSELNAYRKRNVKVATSVAHAVELLGRRSA